MVVGKSSRLCFCTCLTGITAFAFISVDIRRFSSVECVCVCEGEAMVVLLFLERRRTLLACDLN